jgi:hypothetical protein
MDMDERAPKTLVGPILRAGPIFVLTAEMLSSAPFLPWMVAVTPVCDLGNARRIFGCKPAGLIKSRRRGVYTHPPRGLSC